MNPGLNDRHGGRCAARDRSRIGDDDLGAQAANGLGHAGGGVVDINDDRRIAGAIEAVPSGGAEQAVAAQRIRCG
jgi:hypothetical protein